jgi:ubiquinone/menaquinone biosynthesis C-methylase UbiE
MPSKPSSPIAVDSSAVEVRRLFNQDWARQYRRIDESSSDAAHEHYGRLLTTLSSSFGRPIDVLDIGCGTGRYFHRLRNMRRLVGIDLSMHMLKEAHSPLHAEEVSAQTVDLVCGDLRSLSIADGSFDFIYSIGVLGEYSPLDQEIMHTCWRILRPNGLMLVTAVDATSRISVPENEKPSLLRRALRKSWTLMPASIRAASNHWLSPCYLTRQQIERLLHSCGFSKVEISLYHHTSGWLGTHFDCLATRGPTN